MDKGTLSVARIVQSTSTDGVGLRNSLYLSGCNIKCPGCHNKAWWDKDSGKEMSVEEVLSELNEDDFNISILGGEPTMQYEPLVELLKEQKKRYPHKTIWLWSGFVYEFIKEHFPDILLYIDVLVDGPFIEALAEPNLQWRGSTNQRVLNIKEL